ncbi:MAG: OmpA family protein [Archangium sp.]|nr:OmpA family protein [Archangium sp.]MDP3153445.1 OmpA family protein [Archangium sp.]MDP3574681.1 OmpA family protein [Archangium sp.]
MNEQKSSKLPWLLWVLTLAAAIAAGYFALQRLEALQSAQNEAISATELASKKASDCQKELEVATSTLNDVNLQKEALANKANELENKASELTTTLVQKEEELARLMATYNSLEDKMAAEIKRGDVRLSQSEGRIQVDLVDKVLFDSAQAEVSPRGEEVLTRLGAILKGVEDRQIQISGHTDDAPITLPDLKAKFATNWELSTARAVNVVRFLSEKAQVKPGRLLAAGYGQYRPIGANATPRGRAANRRIEILLLPPLQAKKATLPTAAAPKAGKP